ncbi:MAG TPA: hypothetical protein VHL78_12245 [Actinomycetota bacterium]|nr:hypothetical protein [Actinomycetota bacterium]
MGIRAIGRTATLALALVLVGTACGGSVAGLYRSEASLKTLELSDDGTFRLDLGVAAAELAEGPIVLEGRYEVEDGTIRLFHEGNVIDEGTVKGDRVVLENNGVLVAV